ncbi:MAG: hypothetical protein K6B65_02780 [Bacilli bacterium]|nr:hypothetical protein [Bacilli bacterium]
MSFLPLVFDFAASLRSFMINPLVNGLILGIMVLGVFISFRILNIADLSVEGILPMITMVTAVFIDMDVNPILVLLISMALGAIVGILNALLTVYLKIPPLLSGIIMMALTFGVAIMINSLKAGQVSFDANSHLTVFNWLRNLLFQISDNNVFRFYASYLSYILVAALLMVIIGFALYFFFGTELGMSIRAAGKNKEMAEANGISTNKMSIIALAISGALIGFASSLYGQHNGMGLPTDGQGMIVIALSSLFLGEIVIGARTFKRSLLSAIIGSLLYWYVIQVLMLLDTQGYMLSVYKALLLIAIIVLQFGISVFKKSHPKGGEGVKRSKKEALKEKGEEVAMNIKRLCLGGNYVC